MNDEIDILLDRALANELDAEGWGRLEAQASLQPALHRRYFELARDQAELRRLGALVLARSASVALPPAIEAGGARRWVAAALVLAVIGLGFLGGRLSGTRDEPAPATTRALGPDEHLERYLSLGQAQGRVLFELPPTVLEAVRGEGGGTIDLVFVRRIVERGRSNEVVTIERDEYGTAHGRLLAAQELPRESSF